VKLVSKNFRKLARLMSVTRGEKKLSHLEMKSGNQEPRNKILVSFPRFMGS
jgi:hypothetical protein